MTNELESKPKFKITSKKGFHITFSNGVTVSVQFGAGDYCNNRYVEGVKATGFRECANSDVAVWTEKESFNGGYLSYDNKNVTPDEALKIMNWAANLSSDEIKKLLLEKVKE